MPRFRLFFVDSFSRQILSSIEFESADERHAVAFAEERRSLTAMELWTRGGLVKQWAAIPPGGAKTMSATGREQT
jgi:hypothetical protein